MKHTVLVCGGRDLHDRDKLFPVLDFAHNANPIEYLIHGVLHAPAKSMVETWAQERGVPVKQYVTRGSRQRQISHKLIMDGGKPDLVIAFPGGGGTADLIRRARSAGRGIQVVTVSKHPVTERHKLALVRAEKAVKKAIQRHDAAAIALRDAEEKLREARHDLSTNLIKELTAIFANTEQAKRRLK